MKYLLFIHSLLEFWNYNDYNFKIPTAPVQPIDKRFLKYHPPNRH